MQTAVVCFLQINSEIHRTFSLSVLQKMWVFSRISVWLLVYLNKQRIDGQKLWTNIHGSQIMTPADFDDPQIFLLSIFPAD